MEQNKSTCHEDKWANTVFKVCVVRALISTWIDHHYFGPIDTLNTEAAVRCFGGQLIQLLLLDHLYHYIVWRLCKYVN